MSKEKIHINSDNAESTTFRFSKLFLTPEKPIYGKGH